MTNPEIEYRRIVSGDAAALRARVATLEGVVHDIAGVDDDLTHAQDVPVWSGTAASSFLLRMTDLQRGLSLTRSAVVRAHWALDAAAGAYEAAETNAEHYIGCWRNRPTGWPAVIEELFARLVNACLIAVAKSYNQQLAGIRAVLTGDEVTLNELDEETRKWVKDGEAKNQEWLEGNDSSLGPRIPNIGASDDSRGWIPQGLGYDPESGTLLQGYYVKGPDGKTGLESYLAVVDEVTGRELGEVRLGEPVNARGEPLPGGKPTHAGGVTVDGDKVYVADNGKLFTYSLDAIRSAGRGATVPAASVQEDGISGGSYSAIKGGRLYLGDHERDTLHVYEKRDGQWQEVDTLPTPPKVQGVLVRDDEIVYSASSGRHEENSRLYVGGFDGGYGEPYDLPSMSQGVVEVDGQLVVTYESGAEHFDHAIDSTGWLWWKEDEELWGNPFMTRTPLSELGLGGAGEEFEVEPGTLRTAAGELGAPAGDLRAIGAELDGVHVPGHLLGEVPGAAPTARTVVKLVGAAADSARTGARAVAAVAELLRSSATDYARADQAVDTGMRGMMPR